MNATSSLSQTVLKNKYKPLFKFFVEGLKDLYWAEKAIETLLKKNKSLAYTEELSDEIGNLDYSVQVLLLRAIEENKIKKIGSNTEIDVNVRNYSRFERKAIRSSKKRNF